MWSPLLSHTRRWWPPLPWPSFSSAATPAEAEPLFNRFVEKLADGSARVQTGRFGAEMQISLVNDGPVTFWLQVAGNRTS